MEKERKLFVAGNWKMNLTTAEARSLVQSLRESLDGVHEVDIAVCPPFTALADVAKMIQGSNLRLGAQNMSENAPGAFTGEIAAEMLKELGVEYVILGHSERRQYQQETNEWISKKIQKALSESLKPIICIGETLDQRETERTEEVLQTQIQGCLSGMDAARLTHCTLAYEPVWAIGTGRTATAQQAQEAHAFIRGQLEKLFGKSAREIRIQYGGSVKPENARELMSQPDVDGALVGGASIKADSFIKIIQSTID